MKWSRLFGTKKTKHLGQVSLREAVSDDLNHIAEIHRQCFARGWSIDEITSLFGRDTTIMIVAKIPNDVIDDVIDDVVGFNIMRQTTEEAEILSVAVKPEFRGNKIGERLMRTAINKLLTDKIPSLFLEVEESNNYAIKLYKNLGFIQVGEREGYYKKNHNNNAIIMRLDLA